MKYFLVCFVPHPSFKLAQTHNKMDIYSLVVGDAASDTDFANMAVYFEKKGDFFQAGRNYLKAGDYSKVR